MRRLWRLLALLVLLSPTACGQVPQPFRPDPGSKSHNEFLFIKPSVGVTVLQIEGPVDWVGKALAEAMAERLRQRGIAASTGASNRGSYFLAGSGYRSDLPGEEGVLILDWTLVDEQGSITGERQERLRPPSGFWEEPTQEMFEVVADRTAPTVAGWISPQLADRNAVYPTVVIGGVTGAPLDGNQSLRRAIIQALAVRKVPLAESSDVMAVAIGASVRLTPATGTTDQIEIVWRVKEPDGTLIGEVKQANALDKATVSETWRVVAPLIADAAADGILGLVRQSKERRITRLDRPMEQ